MALGAAIHYDASEGKASKVKCVLGLWVCLPDWIDIEFMIP